MKYWNSIWLYTANPRNLSSRQYFWLYTVPCSACTHAYIQFTYSYIYTNSDGLHDSTAAPNAVGGHNTDSMSHIVGHSDWNTSSTGGDWTKVCTEVWTEVWTDSDIVVDWSHTITLWGLPLHCEIHTVPTILLNSGGGSVGRAGS